MTMTSIFNIMPGLEMPIQQVTDTLSKMWQASPSQNIKDSFARSSQLNIILHNGLYASHTNALKSFNEAMDFSKKYPCRIIVLCPEKSQRDDTPLKGKLFSRCFVGEDVRDQCCCEALILGYTTDDAVFLKDQVSLWLENDLPSYYWINEISPKVIKEYYLSLADLCGKVIYDSAIESEAIKNVRWTEHHLLADLALMRLLPVRQSLGQFLSNYSEKILIENLNQVTVECSESYRAEGHQLLEWFNHSLQKCADHSKIQLNVEFILTEIPSKKCFLVTQWLYNGDKFFNWQYDCETGISEIKAKFRNHDIGYPLHLRKMSPEEVLAAAIFY